MRRQFPKLIVSSTVPASWEHRGAESDTCKFSNHIHRAIFIFLTGSLSLVPSGVGEAREQLAQLL